MTPSAPNQRRPAAPPPRRPPPQQPPPPAKPFEIRRGRRRADGTEEDDDEQAPLGQVVLPRSITQEQEEESLKSRFGVENVPDITHKAPILQLSQSIGEGGPSRTGAKGKLALLLLLFLGGALAAAWWLAGAR